LVDHSTTATDQLLLVFIHLNVIEIYGATRLRIMTLSIMTFSIITLNIKGFYVILGIIDIQCNDTQNKGLCVTLSISDAQHK
jgi:hypothetical protein